VDANIILYTSVPDKSYKTQQLLLGTHTNDDEPNYLQIASVKIPKENKSEDTAMEDVHGKIQFLCMRASITNFFAIEENKNNETFIKITQKILHEGEVNRARYQIENPNIIATKSRTGDVYIFDRTTFDLMPQKDEKFDPTLRLTGHHKEG
jgi:histone-binding protein RBBP4